MMTTNGTDEHMTSIDVFSGSRGVYREGLTYLEKLWIFNSPYHVTICKLLYECNQRLYVIKLLYPRVDSVSENQHVRTQHRTL